MKLLLAATLVLMLSSLAIAVPESSQLGPYSVSFDLNTGLPHELIAMETIQGQAVTVYGMQIFTDNTTKARILISQYQSPIDSTLGVYKQLTAMGVALNGFNATSAEDKMIDGKKGFLIQSVPYSGNTMVPADAKLFQALYWMDSQDCECGPVSVGTTSVDITSSYPQDVTESLLSSLQVVKGEAAAPAQGGQVLPPN